MHISLFCLELKWSRRLLCFCWLNSIYSTKTDSAREIIFFFEQLLSVKYQLSVLLHSVIESEPGSANIYVHIRFTAFSNTLCILMNTEKQQNMQRWGQKLGSFHPQPHCSTATHIFVLLLSPLKTRTSNNWWTHWRFLLSKTSQHEKQEFLWSV